MSAPKLTEMPAETLPVPRILKEVSRRIVGQDAMVERLLVGMLTGGHILLEGVPGLAKTLAVRTLSEIINATFSRIQFTPDLLPADLIGTMVFDQKTQEFHVKKGPLFAQVKIDPASLPLVLPPREASILQARMREAIMGPAAHLQ